jgi:hypothetical protein
MEQDGVFDVSQPSAAVVGVREASYVFFDKRVQSVHVASRRHSIRAMDSNDCTIGMGDDRFL